MSDTGARRLPTGGLIDRSKPLGFTFDGVRMSGFAGDTLASALVAAGVTLVGRSFKYHRPRGILSAGAEEPNALVELRSGARREPNTRATTAELYDGLVAVSQNRWPSLRFDALAVNQLAAPLLGAGFYYKTFMWPASFWERVYEPLIRRAAGLGRAADAHDPDRYEKATLHCDVLVVGAGPAGLMAALAAGRSGARVVLAEDDVLTGGRLNGEDTTVDGEPGSAWAARVTAELAAMPEVTLLTRTTVFGTYDHGAYGAVQRLADHLAVPPAHGARQKLWRIVARRSVLAAGAIERPLVFGDNDRPGIMLAGAVRTYVHRFAAVPGHRAVVVASTDDAARTVATLAAAGVHVQAVVDGRPEGSAAVRAAAEAAGAWLMTGSMPLRAHGRAGVQALDVRGPGGQQVTVACDLVAMSGGWTPSIHLATHLGGRAAWDAGAGAFLPGSLPPGMALAGAAGGAFSLDESLASGAYAGIEAARAAGFEPPAVDVPSAPREPGAAVPPRVGPAHPGKAFVDFQNDVTAADVALAHRESFSSVEHLKRYTTLGMATDQGKTSNDNALALLAALKGEATGAAGTTTFRPPYTPVAIGTLAGHHRGKAFRPTRLTAAHAWAVEQGAVFIETGAWLRAGWFSRPGEDWLAACTREVTATRSAVGICDVSTLGKIDVQGPDAARFLDRVYCNTMSTLPVGRCRYGLMLREDGFVFDDGTIARLGEDHYLMTTTTAKAGEVMSHLEFALQWLWPDLDVQVASVTEQWTQFAVAGPNSRALLARILDPGQDISGDAVPYLACRPVSVMGGVRARLFRLSFSGELAYEIGVPSGYGDALPRALMSAGADLGATPYGLEAMSVMRIEKGHVAGGELNGQTTAADLGLGRMVSQKKDCIGRVMATRPALLDPERETLVGFKVVEPGVRVSAGAHFLDLGAAPTLANDLGHVTATAFSPHEDGWIGLGLMRRGSQRVGDRVRAWDGVRKRDVVVELRHPVFFDPEGVRLRG